MTTPDLYLASASPRRSELLRQIGVAHQQFACDVDERVLPGESPDNYVARVARAKAQAGLARVPANAVVLAADTAVILGGRILGKPADADEAFAMLRALSGRTHEVLSVIAVADQSRLVNQSVRTGVRFRVLADSEIHAYWLTGEPQDKAGSYGIQGLGAVFVEHIEGSYSAVVGLPLLETAALLRTFGVACWQQP